MNINDFIKDFANQFDDTDLEEFSSETEFEELEEWSSLTALAALNMMKKKYGVVMSLEEMKQANTIQELFDLLQSKA